MSIFSSVFSSQLISQANSESVTLSSNFAKKRFLIDCETSLDWLNSTSFNWATSGSNRRHALRDHLMSFAHSALKTNCQFVLMFDGTVPTGFGKASWVEQQRQRGVCVDEFFSGLFSKEPRFWLDAYMLNQFFQIFVNDLDISKGELRPPVLAFNTLVDHNKEIMQYCVEHDCDGVFTSNLELIVLFSLQYREEEKLLLLPKGLAFENDKCTALKFKLDTFLKNNELSNEQFNLLYVLFGTRWLPCDWLMPLYGSILHVGYDMQELTVRIFNII
jgi:hypothetical protein